MGIHFNGHGQIDSNEYVQNMFFIDKINGFGILLASHCPEVDTRWSYECGILNFARNSSRTLI